MTAAGSLAAAIVGVTEVRGIAATLAEALSVWYIPSDVVGFTLTESFLPASSLVRT
jgi:hypothetical protein